MNEKPRKVGEIARQLGVTTNTVRNWCRRYEGYLSATANPPGGGERLFSTRDLNVLTYIHAAVNDGVNHDDLAMQLAEKSFSDGDVDIVVGMAEVVAEELPAEAAQTPQESRHDDLLLPVVISNHEARLQALERQVHSGASWAITWAIIGAGIMLVAVAVALYFG